jgi:HK97 family phage prohead protease
MEFVGARTFKTFHVRRSPTGGPLRVKDPSITAGIRKMAVETIEKLNDRTLTFTISTGAVDRDQDMIDVKGWQTDHFARNPVVLWAHRADELPIGKAVDFGRDDRRLYSAVEFLPGGYGDASELADTVYRMAADGYLNATSVGFRPLAWDFTDDETRGADTWMPGIDFHQQELVELSIVCVPSNPEALIDAAGIPIEPGGGSQDVGPVISPAPVQVLAAERYRRRARAALLGVFPRECET